MWTKSRPLAQTNAAPPAAEAQPVTKRPALRCDRCGEQMREKSCKVVCPNCGNRFDCSDLNIYFDWELLTQVSS